MLTTSKSAKFPSLNLYHYFYKFCNLQNHIHLKIYLKYSATSSQYRVALKSPAKEYSVGWQVVWQFKISTEDFVAMIAINQFFISLHQQQMLYKIQRYLRDLKYRVRMKYAKKIYSASRYCSRIIKVNVWISSKMEIFGP